MSSSDLLEQVRDLPETPGVYYFLNQDDYPVYIGKSVNIRQRVRSHIYSAGSDLKEKKIIMATRRVTCTPTPGELSALLLESREVKSHAPLFNRRLRKEQRLLTWQLSDEPPLLRLAVATWPPQANVIDFGLYRNKTRARKHLEMLVSQHGLCKKMLGLESARGACFGYQLKRCKGVCIGSEPMDTFVARLKRVLAVEATKPWPYGGAVGIVEVGQDQVISVVDQWYYLGAATNEGDARALCQNRPDSDPLLLDRDSYRILVGFLMRPAKGVRIIPLFS